MGQSTDAYLFYGLTAGDEEGGYPDSVVEQHPVIVEDWEDDAEFDYDATKAFHKKLKDEFGVSFDTHCSCDYPMPFLHVIMNKEDDYYTAWRGSPIKVDTHMTSMQRRHWDLQLSEAAEFLGWPEDHRDPGWWLASNWC